MQTLRPPFQQQYWPNGQHPSSEPGQHAMPGKQHSPFGQHSRFCGQQTGLPGSFGHAFSPKFVLQMRAQAPVTGSHPQPGRQQTLLQQLLPQQVVPQRRFGSLQQTLPTHSPAQQVPLQQLVNGGQQVSPQG